MKTQMFVWLYFMPTIVFGLHLVDTGQMLGLNKISD